jgi:hypothetical protein
MLGHMRMMQGSPLYDMFESRMNTHGGNINEAQEDTLRLMSKGVDQGDISFENVTLDDLFNVFVAPKLIERGIPFDPRHTDFAELTEEITSTQFLFATNKLINPMMIEAYEMAQGDILQLVREVESNHREETYVGTTDGDEADYVPEAMPYPEVGMQEKRVRIENFKFGKGISITAEMMRFDQTGSLVDRAQDAGTSIADILEEFIVFRITDLAFPKLNEASSTAFVYNGTARAIYADDHTTTDGRLNDNLASSAQPSVSVVRGMVNLLKNMVSEKGRPVRVRPTIVFGDDQMEIVLRQFFQLQPVDFDNTASASGESGNRNPFQNAFRIITSPFCSTATQYYIGDFARQFILQWVWRPRTNIDRKGDPRRDIVGQFFASFYAGCGARDYRFVVKNAG